MGFIASICLTFQSKLFNRQACELNDTVSIEQENVILKSMEHLVSLTYIYKACIHLEILCT